MEKPGDTTKRSVFMISTIAIVLVGIVLYLSANNKVISVSQTPFIQQSDGTYTMKPNEIICEGPCPPPSERLPGVNFYKKTGAIALGNVTIKPTADGNAVVQYAGTIFSRFKNGSMLIGDAEIQHVLPGNIYLTGMVPTSQNAFDFALTLSTFVLAAGDGHAVNVDRVKERAGSLGRTGWRLRTSQVQYTFFATPTPQIIEGNPSSRYITNNIGSSLVTEDSEFTLGAYPCVQGPFRDAFARLSITVNEYPSTCFNTIVGRNTETILKLTQGYTCIPSASMSDILSNEESFDTYPSLCFLSSACDLATTIIPAKQRMAGNGNVSTSTQTIPLGCTIVDNIYYSVKCTRASL